MRSKILALLVLCMIAAIAATPATPKAVPTKVVPLALRTHGSALTPVVPARTDAYRAFAQKQRDQALKTQKDLPPTDNVVTCYPQSVNYWTGTTTASSKTQTSMLQCYGDGNRGWFNFDVSAIPAGATINSVTLHFYCTSMNWPYWAITRMTNSDPVNDGASTVYADIAYTDGDGYYLQNYFDPTVGWNSFDIGSVGANADLENKLAGGWFPVGIHEFDGGTSFWINCDGWAESNVPYIDVDYSAPIAADVQMKEIIYPSVAMLWSEAGFNVRGIVKNNDPTSPQTFDVNCTDGGSYNSTVNVTVAAGATQTVNFAYFSGAPGPCVLTYTTLLPGDADPSNDVLTRSKNVAAAAGDSLWYLNGPYTNGWYYYEFNPEWLMATQFTPAAWPASIDYVAVGLLGPFNTTWWPWPDATLDSIRLHIWLDSDNNGYPNEPQVYQEQLVNDTIGPDDWVYATPVPGSIVVQEGDWWVGMINCQGGGSEGILVSDMTYSNRQWTREGTTEADWTQISMYGDQWFKSGYTVQVFNTDIAVRSIVAPNGIMLPGAVAPEAYVKNVGLTAYGAFDVQFDIGAYSELMPVAGLAPGESVLVTFPDWTATGGSWTATCAALVSDDNPANDVKTASVMVVDYFENFDSDNGGFTQMATDAMQWEWGDPDFPLGPESYSSPNCWGTNLTGYYANGAYWRLFSIEYQAFQDNPVLLFMHNLNCETSWDGGNVKYSTNGGSSWTLITGTPAYYGQVVGLFYENGWSGNSNGWQLVTMTVPVTAGTAFELMWTFGSDASVNTYPGWYIDDVAGVGFGIPGNPGDVAVTNIIAPTGSYLPNTEVTPQATWRNTGTTPMDFTAYMFLTNPDGSRGNSQFKDWSLEGGEVVNLAFDPYTVVDTGTWAVKCSTVAAGDTTLANDQLEGTFRVSEAPPVPPGWRQVADIPMMPSGRAVKDGGCLAYDAGTDAIYASKGYKTGDFYKYEYPANDWTILASVPFGGDGKQVYKGSVICSDGNGKMYLIKGNNTMGFWQYDAASDVWTQLSDVPYGESGKKVKQGAGIAWSGDAAYLLKGYRNEFYKYDPAAGWITLTPAPIGWHKKWDAGSWLVADPTPGSNMLYAFKGKYHEFYSYNIETKEWSTFLHAMPIPGNAGNKKAKDGSSAAWFDGDIYAFKGGNTTEFWKYFTASDSWVQLADIPMYGNSGRRKKVKQGGAVAGYPSAGALYALKGNKTFDFWRYGPYMAAGAQPSREGVMAGNLNIGDVSFAIAPNPLAGGLATVRYSLPKAGLATLYVYDVTGRTVLTQTLAAGRTGTAGLDLRKLDAGVYLVKVATEGFSTTQKLVVQH